MLEKFLTAPPEEFQRYLRSAPELTEDEIDTRREAYRYSKVHSKRPPIKLFLISTCNQFSPTALSCALNSMV